MTRVLSPSSQFVGGLDRRQVCALLVLGVAGRYVWALVALGGTSAAAAWMSAEARRSFIFFVAEQRGNQAMLMLCSYSQPLVSQTRCAARQRWMG